MAGPWYRTIPLELTADGNVIGDTDGDEPTILDASFGSGRPDWFGSLSPGQASFTVRGDLTGSVACGDALVLTNGSSTLFSGKVDSVVLEQAPDQEDRTVITGADIVAQLGEARFKNNNIASGQYSAQLREALSDAGISATVTRAPSVGDLGQLAAWSNYTGTVLDWIDTAERYANCISSFRPDGSVVACIRSVFPDYGQRVFDPEGGGDDAVPNAEALWRMDNSSGNILDEGNTAKDGTAAGSPTYSQTGPWGAGGPTAIGFQKADAADRFSMGDVYDLTANTTWTISGWAYWAGAAGSDDTLVAKMTSTDANGWEVKIDYANAALRYRVRNTSATTVDVVTPNSTVPTTSWFHWAVVRDGSDLRIYLATAANGYVPTLQVTGTAVTPPNTTTGFMIGSRAATTNWFGGRQCMVAVWPSTALTQANLDQLVNLGVVDLPTPKTWQVSRSITSVINHWLIGGVASSRSTSISTYGRRTWDVDSSTELSGSVYSADLKTVMKDPRPIVSATFDILDSSSVLLTMGPLDIVEYDGDIYQVLDIRHTISTATWEVALTLDRTRNDMTDGSPLLPA